MDLGLLCTEYPAVTRRLLRCKVVLGTNECKSTGGFVFTMGGAVISWKSKKPTLITQSSMMSEFFALIVAEIRMSSSAVFFKTFRWKNCKVQFIHYDNQAMSTMVANSIFNKKKQTIHLKYGYLNKLICHRVISVIDIRSSENVAYPLTKVLKKELVERTFAGMGLKLL